MSTRLTGLPVAVPEFAARYRDALMDPATAFDLCKPISDEFAALAREHGLADVEVLCGAKIGEAPGLPGVRLFLAGHFAVRVGDEVYDWTARQFDPHAAVPTVRTLADWRAEWPPVEEAR